jgi:hypothetical protein
MSRLDEQFVATLQQSPNQGAAGPRSSRQTSVKFFGTRVWSTVSSRFRFWSQSLSDDQAVATFLGGGCPCEGAGNCDRRGPRVGPSHSGAALTRVASSRIPLA